MEQPGLTETGSPQPLLEKPTKGVLVLEPAIPQDLGTRVREVGDSLLAHPATKGSEAEQQGQISGSLYGSQTLKNTHTVGSTLKFYEVRPRQKSIMVLPLLGSRE